ncbi:hypothetical protein [Desertivirga arenae]|uniref:hypothetical protein n=1 Tax=Desertivirga arenae TaxID=2810309 RepID=UPI001A971C31|nr:hypothetical protein [Pedobacter sp. SYSU D00823]
MKQIFFKIFCCFILLLSLGACRRESKTEPAFYYWKTTFNLPAEDRLLLKNLFVKKIYLRLFDIRWDEAKGSALPAGVIKFKQELKDQTIVPVVYITNKTLVNSDQKGIDSLAVNTFRLLGNIMSNHNIAYQSIQIDCDWTESTKEKYFRYLKILRKISGKPLEATIRLHQVKYKDRTGVPPVETGVLMYYNMGKLTGRLDARNSIYNEVDASKYTSYISNYPLQLDIALPLFSWTIQIRDSKIKGLFNKLSTADLLNSGAFKSYPNYMIAKRSFFFKGIYIKENDIFKLEEINTEVLQQATEQLSTALPKNNKRTILFYELGNLDHFQFKAETLKQISSKF